MVNVSKSKQNPCLMRRKSVKLVMFIYSVSCVGELRTKSLVKFVAKNILLKTIVKVAVKKLRYNWIDCL